MNKLFLLIVVSFVFIVNIANSEQPKPLAAYKLDNKWYIIDEQGRGLFNPLDVKLIAGYSEGFYRINIEVDSSKFWGFMNDKGEVAIPMSDEIRLFNEGMAMINDLVDQESEMRLYGFINKNGQLVVPKQYLDAVDFSEGLAWVMNRKERGYVDKSGKMVIQWDTVGFGSVFKEGLAAISNDKDRFGFINKKGEIVIPFEFDEVTNFSNGLARVNILGKWGFINKNGVLEIEADYDFALDFVEGVCFVGVPKADVSRYIPSWGIINRGGGKVVDFIYDEVRDFDSGLGCVKVDNKWKVIDYFGKAINEKLFDDLNAFRNGLAWAVEDDKSGYIDPTGKFVFEIPKDAEFVVDLRLNIRVK